MAASERRKGAVQLAGFVTDAETETMLTTVLGDMSITDCLVKRGGIDVAIDYLSSHASPRIVVVDVTKSALPLSDINALADACEPGVEVIVIGEQNDIGLFRDLLQIGVSDYLAKPVTRDLMRRAIEKIRMGIASVSMKGRTGKVVAVTGVRGGLGTTTIAANLGWILSHKIGRRVSLVDLDFNYGSLSLALDQRASPGLREALENVHRVDQLFLERTLVHVNQRLALLSCEEPLDYTLQFESRGYDQLQEHLSKQFHYVIIDVPHGAGAVYQHVLKTASVRIIVIDATLASVRHAIRLIKDLGSEEIGRQTIVVLNRRWAQTEADLSVEEIEKALNHRIDVKIGFVKKGLVEAENSGKIIAGQSPIFTEGLLDIVQELSGRPRVRKSLLQRLFGGAVVPHPSAQKVEPIVVKAGAPEAEAPAERVSRFKMPKVGMPTIGAMTAGRKKPEEEGEDAAGDIFRDPASRGK